MEHFGGKSVVLTALMKASKEEALKCFRAIFNSAADMIWIRDLENGHLLEVNNATLMQLGYTRKEMIGRPVYEFYFSEKDREVGVGFAKTVKTAGVGYMTAAFRTSTGQVVEVEMHGSLVKQDGSKEMLVIARGIGESLQEHRRATTLYEAFKRSNDIMFYSDRNGIILDINEAFTKHYGYTRAEVLGKKPNILKSRHSTREMYERMWSSILDPKKGYWRGEIINKARDGREIPLILTITAVKDPKGQILGYMSNAVDITEQVALQGRVANAEALATIGEMAAVVAHEIRNPLSSIVMASKHLTDHSLGKEDRDMVLKVLRNESQRLNEALTNFLTYARPREIKLEPHDLNVLVSEVYNIVHSNHDLIKKVRTHLSVDPGLKPFRMDADQIRQVIWNIVLNAIQAMDGQGKLTVATGRAKGHAYFTVSDSGPGIPEALRVTIFKPFQTTKQQGTGLGLAIAERIVKAHGGRIDVDSSPDAGTTFSVYLPQAEE